jgi:hypothetical protein
MPDFEYQLEEFVLYCTGKNWARLGKTGPPKKPAPGGLVSAGWGLGRLI